MKNKKEKPTGVVAYLLYVIILWVASDNVMHNLVRLIKLRYLDEEQGNKNPTDRRVLGVHNCSWDLLLTMLFAK